MPHSEATTEKENKYNKYKTASAALILQPKDKDMAVATLRG